MAFGDKAGLLFEVNANADPAIREFGKLRLVARDATQDIARHFAQGVPGVTGFANSLGPVSIGLAAVTGAGLAAVGALGALIQSAVTTGSAFNDLSLKTGLSVEMISGLSLQLKQSGTDTDTFARAVFILQKNLGEAASGNEKLAKTFANLGVKDASAALRDTDGTVRTLFKSLGELKTEGERNATGAKVLGKSFSELSVFLADTGGDLDAVIEKAREMGTLMSTKAAMDADRLGDAIDELSTRASMFGVNIGARIIPSILNALDEANAGYQGHAGVVGSVVNSVISYLENEIDKLAILANQVNNIGRIGAAMYAGGIGGGFNAAFAAESERQGRKVQSQVLGDVAVLEAMAKRFGASRLGDVSGAAGKRGGADKAEAERRKRMALDLADVQRFNREIEADYRANREAIDRELQRKLTDFETYAENAHDEQAIHYREQQEAFDREERVIRKFVTNADELYDKLEELRLKREVAADDDAREKQRIEDQLLDARTELIKENTKAWLDNIEAKVKAKQLADEQESDADLAVQYGQAERLRDLVEAIRSTNISAGLPEQLSVWEQFRDSLGAVLDDLGARTINFGTMMQTVLSGIMQGVMSNVNAWILYGKVGPNAARQVAAGIISSLVQIAIVKAVHNIAEGFENLAKAAAAAATGNVAAAALYNAAASSNFVSAAKWGAGAVLGAIAGRAVAGNSFSQGGSAGGGAGSGGTGGGASTSSSNDPTIINESRPRVVEYHHIFHFEPTEDATVRHIKSNVGKNGDLRPLIVEVAAS